MKLKNIIKYSTAILSSAVLASSMMMNAFADFYNYCDKQDNKEAEYISFFDNPDNVDMSKVPDSEVKPEITIDKVQVSADSAGKIVPVDYNISGAEDEASTFTIITVYDTRLKLVNYYDEETEKESCVKKGSAIEKLLYTTSSFWEDGIFAVSGMDIENSIKDGVLFTAFFKLPEDAKDGDLYPVGLAYRSLQSQFMYGRDEKSMLMNAWLWTNGVTNGYIKVGGEGAPITPPDYDPLDYLSYYKFTDHIEIDECSSAAEGEFVIPSTIADLPVTDFNDGVFWQCELIKSIVIPDSITNLGASTFRNCSSLEKVNIPDGVTDIQPYTFSGCSSLGSITLRNNITSISHYAFECCPALDYIIIENPDCEIYDDSGTICSGYSDEHNEKGYFTGTIYGHEGSTAQAYAEKYGYKFDLIENAPTTDITYGDANEDGEISIDDAVLIMQALANPDKYGVGGTDANAMTEQGKKNADCFDPGSDLTAKDALSVQRFLLKSIDSLPENADKPSYGEEIAG